mgnify:CR=1 FL=1
MTISSSNIGWFLAQIKPNCAKIAEKNLRRQGITSFLPTEEKTVERRGKFSSVAQLLFPGYIFVSLDVAQGRWRTVNSTYGITKLVSFGSKPSQVPSELISELMMRCDDTGQLLPPKKLNPGDKVRMMTGPFSGFLAEVEAMTAERRVWILMDIMGGQTRVAANAEQLQAV